MDIFVDQLNDDSIIQLSDQYKMGFLINNHPRKRDEFIVKGYRRRRSASEISIVTNPTVILLTLHLIRL